MTHYPGHAASDDQFGSPASRWRRSRSGPVDPHTSLLFWLTVVVLASVSLLVVSWGASSVLAQKGSEKLLRVERLFPKLKSSHGERKADAFRMSEHENSELPHPKERKTPVAAPVMPTPLDLPKLLTFEPPHMDASPVPLELAPAEICQDPLIYQQRCTSQPGDSPMIRNWKTLTMVSLLSTAALTFAPQPAVMFAQDNGKKDAVEIKGLDELQKSITALLERIDKLEKKKAPAIDQEELTKVIRDEIRAELKKAQDAVKSNVAALQQVQLAHKTEIDKLSDEIGGLRKKLAEGGAAPAVDKAFMEEFRSSIKSLNDTIAKLGPTKERISGSPPINGSTSQGRLVIVNLYNEDLLFLVNGAPHRVPGGMSKILDVPAGALHYRVHSNRWGPLSNQTTTLAVGETFTLTAANQK